MPQQPQRRIFFALEMQPEIRRGLAELSGRLQKAVKFTPARISWVPPENFHVTLYFLGDTPQKKAEELASLLQEAAAGIPPFRLDIRHLGVFPSAGRLPPKVLWAGVHRPPDAVHELRDHCASIIAKAGLPVPDQNFTPHITMARIKSTKGLGPFRQQIRTYEHVKIGHNPVDHVTLMESITGKGPARYLPYASANFA